jgi:archaemetzincin
MTMDDGFERLGPPRRGEWRSIVREPAQSFDDYAARCANRRSRDVHVLYLQPLGPAPAALELFREYAALCFGLEARIRPALPLPVAPVRGQADSTAILHDLAALVPADGLLCMGVTGTDLAASGKAWVFGESDLARRCGVCSVARLGAPDDPIFLRRALKLLTHEAGHVLSIAHCTTHRCVMQGSNSLEESDGHPLHFCPEDLRKLEWNTGADRADRYRGLREFFLRRGWTDDARWIGERLR